jgi:hypothetical protein
MPKFYVEIHRTQILSYTVTATDANAARDHGQALVDKALMDGESDSLAHEQDEEWEDDDIEVFSVTEVPEL